MRKLSLLLALLLAIGFSSITPALAEDLGHSRVHTDKDDDKNKDQEDESGEHHDSNRMHKDLDDRYGAVERVMIPPMGFIPEELPNGDVFVLPDVTQLEITEVREELTDTLDANYLMVPVGQGSALKVSASPSKYPPIQFKDLVITKISPADEFVRSSVLVLLGLAVLATILLALVSKNVLSLRRRPKNY